MTQAALYSITHAGLTSEFISMPAINIMGFRFNTTVSGNEYTAMWEQFDRQIPAGLLTALHKADIKLILKLYPFLSINAMNFPFHCKPLPGIL